MPILLVHFPRCPRLSRHQPSKLQRYPLLLDLFPHSPPHPPSLVRPHHRVWHHHLYPRPNSRLLLIHLPLLWLRLRTRHSLPSLEHRPGAPRHCHQLKRPHSTSQSTRFPSTCSRCRCPSLRSVRPPKKKPWRDRSRTSISLSLHRPHQAKQPPL